MNKSNFKIGNKTIGDGNPCFIIAEVAQAHDGSLGMAHAFIDVVSTTGADAIKFQTHFAEEESSLDEPWRVKFSTQDKSRYDYWKRMEFTKEQWHELKVHAESVGLIFLSSPFSEKAVEILASIDMPAWKIASGEISDKPLLDAIAKTDRPVLLSTGMSGLNEIDSAIEYFQSRDINFAVMQCSTSYPCKPESVGLNMISEFKERYKCPVGLSDHSGTVFPGLAATTLGAKIIEIHITMTKHMFGPDVPASVTPDELKLLVDGIRFIDTMNENPVDKNRESIKVEELRKIFFKGLVAKHDLTIGTVLTENDISAKKPESGIPVSSFSDVIGSEIQRDLKEGEPINWSDLII
jgi:N,N'-diacetyllegionaminate synthase